MSSTKEDGPEYAPRSARSERHSALGGAPTDLYYFRWQLDERRKTPHASEIASVFDNLHTRENLERRQQALALSAKMSDAWIAFARTGDPNTDDLPAWHPYNVDRRSTMVFDLESRLVDDPIRRQRDILDPILAL